MDIITAIIYIILFIILMVFVFSMGLLTPIIGNKDIVSVVIIGFIIGLVGGAFFITPMYEELPYVVGSIQETISGENELINIEVSPIVDHKKIISDLNKKDGVVSVVNKGIVIKTDPFSDKRKAIIEEKVLVIDKNFKSCSVDKNGLISINFTSGHDPNQAIKVLSDWLMYTGEIKLRYSLIQFQIAAKANQVDKIVSYLNSENIVVTSVNGPVHDAVNNTKNSMSDNNMVILFSGLIGAAVALISIFFDQIVLVIKRIISKFRR